MFLFLLGMAHAFPDMDIEVVAHRDLEVYVAPIELVNTTSNIEVVYNEYSVFGYASTHSHNAMIMNKTGLYEPIKISPYEELRFYNEDTIKYSWDNCNYKEDAKDCVYKNNHYLLETYITVDKNELIVAMYLYDSNMQIISQGISTDRRTVKWIKQQEQLMITENQLVRGNSCSGSSCTPGTGQSSSRSTVSKPKEELPLKWEIPHALFDKYIHQASLLLWCSTKLKE